MPRPYTSGPDWAARHQTVADAETSLIRDEAPPVITMRAAPGTSAQIDAADISRPEGEADADFAKRQALRASLRAIPDSD